ncbi:MAG TPA: GNAT family protein [Solirubrobacteraceae bacterium]|nr:GNAT family protein [Solirubrobacteraceae bacterium]
MDLSLRDTTEADLRAVQALECDPDVAPWISPWPRERHVRTFSDADMAHLTYSAADGRFEGFLLLAGLTDPAGSLELRRIALQSRGRGLRSAAFELALARCFDTYGARRVWLDMLPSNERAAAVYARAGLLDEGILVNAHPLPDGSLGHLRVMSISARERAATRASPRVS